METKKVRCRNRGSRHSAELPKGLIYHWGPIHPLANSDFAVGLLGLHFFIFAKHLKFYSWYKSI